VVVTADIRGGGDAAAAGMAGLMGTAPIEGMGFIDCIGERAAEGTAAAGEPLGTAALDFIGAVGTAPSDDSLGRSALGRRTAEDGSAAAAGEFMGGVAVIRAAAGTALGTELPRGWIAAPAPTGLAGPAAGGAARRSSFGAEGFDETSPDV
jgi:hypothetical protein